MPEETRIITRRLRDRPDDSWTMADRERVAHAMQAAMPAGANVEFVTIQHPARVAIKVYERGVGWTQACGTGSVATVAVLGVACILLPLVVLSLIALLAVWITAAPRLIARWAARTRRSTNERVMKSWQRACNALTLAGAPLPGGSTPLEYAELSEQATGVDHRTIRELAMHVTRAVYSPASVTESTASRSETLGSEIDVMCRQRTPWTLRLRGFIDPRMMRRRLG